MYPYRGLDSSRREIRVLQSVTSEDENDARVRCTLLHVSLDESPEYDALSYTWGTPEPSKAIFVDGFEVRIGANLFGALKRFRHLNQLLWVDSLCINQSDQQERTDQVCLMGEIFKMASLVYMWLGEKKDNSDAALAFLENLQQNMDTQTDLAIRMMDDQEYDKFWNAINKLFQRPYWSRVWIVQEVLLAKYPVVCCGTLSCSWAFIQALMCVLHTRSLLEMSDAARGALGSSSTNYTRTLARLSDQRFKGRKMSLVNCLVLSRQREATDPRDHVYGMLNLVEAQGIMPDYTISVETLYRDTARRMIEEDNNLDILSACVNTAVHSNRSNLPSWVPDWKLSADDANSLFLAKEGKCSYRASKGTPARSNFNEKDPAVLTVEGFILDEVHAVSLRKSVNCIGNLMTASIMEDFAIWESVKSDDCPYGDLFKQELAFEKTMFLGRDYGTIEQPVMLKIAINQTNKNQEADAKIHSGIHLQDYLSDEILVGQRTAMNLRFSVTKKGYMGRGPLSVREGDIVAILFGAKVPFILRKFKDNYILLGECYIHGVMDGEAMDALDKGIYDVQEFRLH